MTQPTPRQRELAQLGTAIETGNFNRQTKERFRELLALEVQDALRPVIADLERQLPALQRAVQRRQAARQQFASDAHRRAHDAIVRNKR